MNVDPRDPIFHDEDKAREYFETQRWPDGKPFCVHCGATNVHRLEGKSHRAGLIQCNDCLLTFTVTTKSGDGKLARAADQMGAGLPQDGRQQERHLRKADAARVEPWQLPHGLVCLHARPRGDEAAEDEPRAGSAAKARP